MKQRDTGSKEVEEVEEVKEVKESGEWRVASGEQEKRKAGPSLRLPGWQARDGNTVTQGVATLDRGVSLL